MAAETRQHILIVEDDTGVATLQRRRLERSGFTADVAPDTDSALARLAAGGVDLVVIDYRLGQTSGLDLHRRMNAAGFHVPVIMVSGSLDDATIIEAMRAGVRDVIVKTVDYLEYLPDAVRGVLQQTAAVPEMAARQDKRGCVLVLEDDPDTAMLEKRQLERAGYDVKVALDAHHAIEEVRRGHVALVVLDLRLQGDVSGLDVFEQLRGEGLHVPAILVTAFPDQAVAIRALRAGVRDFVPKSADFLEDLPAAVDRVISQVRVERKLIESELRLASIIGTTMDAIVMCDPSLRIVLFNRSAEHLFGCSATHALGRRLDAFIPGLAPEAMADSGAAGMVRERREVDAIRTDGTSVPLEVSVSDVVLDGGRLFTIIARDISERRRIEQELREADRRKDAFLGMLAHELRNPLAAIMTAGEVLQRTNTEPRAGKMLNVVRRQSRGLARMVDDLLDVSRVTLGKIQLVQEPLLLDDVVTKAVEGIRPAADAASVRLETEIDPEPVWLNGDPTRIEQVLTNLLQNAVKFTPEGGHVSVRAGREDDCAVIRVRDSGIGIEPLLLPRVFDLFVQADTSLAHTSRGLGIGLALVRQLVKLHGGDVTAASGGVGKGSEFVVRLPAVPAETAAMVLSSPVEAEATSGMRVLVVDDEADIADSVAQLLGTFGHEAQAVYDGPAALAFLRATPPDVMLIDIGMPGLSGYDVAREVRMDPTLEKIRLVALTGYGRDEDRGRAQEAGFDRHLTKPVADDKLRSTLAELSSQRPE